MYCEHPIDHPESRSKKKPVYRIDSDSEEDELETKAKKKPQRTDITKIRETAPTSGTPSGFGHKQNLATKTNDKEQMGKYGVQHFLKQSMSDNVQERKHKAKGQNRWDRPS